MTKKTGNKKGKTPKELMNEHLKNKNDVITEEEFKNMEVGTEIKDTGEEELELPDTNDRPKDEDKDPSITTPWDIIK